MRDLPILAELPQGFAVERGARGVVAVRGDLVAALRAAGFGADADGDLRESDLSGRAPLGELELSGAAYVVRAFRHGGLLRFVTGDRYLDPARPIRQLILAHTMRSRGLPTPEVVAARARSLGGPAGGYRLALVSRRVVDARDGGETLERMRGGEIEASVRAGLFAACGALIRSLHEAGFEHADLQPRNLLVRRAAPAPEPPELLVIDLEGSRLGDRPLGERERVRNLARLARAVLRRESRGTPFLRSADLVRFLRAYEPDPRRRRALAGAVRTVLARGRPLHRAGWLLERVFGADPAARDGAARVRS